MTDAVRTTEPAASTCPRQGRHRGRPGFALAAWLVLALAGGSSASKATSLLGPETTSLTFEQRVACQTAIEEVYWRHRIWPKENPQPKPPLADVMPRVAIERKAADALAMSAALTDRYEVTLEPEDLQAELDRMARGTQDPKTLAELFAALGNDAALAAECLARPALADRRLRSAYAFDSREHGALGAQARAEVAAARDLATLRRGSGEVSITVERREAEGGPVEPRLGAERDRAVEVPAAEWDTLIADLTAELRPPGPGSELPRATSKARVDELPVGRLGTLREEADRFVVRTVTRRGSAELEVATVAWPKRPFDAWWASERSAVHADRAPSPTTGSYHLPQMTMSGGCTDDTWLPSPGLNASLPGARWSHAAVWTGTEMIVWGGYSGSGGLNSGGRYNPSTDTWAAMTATAAPTARWGPAAAVWTGSEMVVWGGYNGTVGVNTGGRYNPTTDTWVATGGASAPTGRYGHTLIWTGTQMVVWGGGDGAGAFLNTGGRYTPGTDSWSATSLAAAPSVRYFHSAVWSGSEMLVWGGYGGSWVNTGGRYTPSTDSWVATSTASAPSARFFHTAVWTGTQMVAWGGSGAASAYFNTGGRYDPTTDTWSATSVVGAPTARDREQAVWTGSKMVVWGGSGGASDFNTGGRYDPSTDIWTATSVVSAPSARTSHTTVWTGTEMVVWGGNTGGSPFATGGRYNPVTDSWVATSTSSAPAARYVHSVVWTGSEMVVWGGYGGSGTLNTGGRYSPATDGWLATSLVSAPASRFYHPAIWTGAEMVVWGGYDGNGNTTLNTGGRYNPATDSWLATTLASAPSARARHSAVWTGAEMVVWGGFGISALSTGGRYNPTTDSWLSTSLDSAPAARELAAAVWTGSEMVVWGGNDGGYLNSGGRYRPTTDSWTAMSLASAPIGRVWHTAVWTGLEVVVWGGWSGGGAFNTGGRYNPSTDSWASTSLVSAPAARLQHAAVWTGTQMIVWGGWSGGSLNTGGRYFPFTDTWGATSLASVPEARQFPTSAWTSTQMVVWGGSGASGLLSGGGRYCAIADTNAPDNPPALASTTHITGAWSGTNQITMQWSGAADEPGGSGLAGYSVLFDTSSTTVPDSTVDVAQTVDPHTPTSAVLADGSSWYFHLRTCDGAGNCSAAVHAGPFWIDTAAPTAPGAVTSPSHPTGVPTADPTVDVAWGAASDVAAGVDGYGYIFTTDATPSCTGAKLVAETTLAATSVALDPASYYVHVCARDNAGNWGAVATGGPYVVTGAVGPLGGAGFGNQVATTGTWLFVAANKEDTAAGIDAGKVYSFERDSGGAGAWGLVRLLTASDAAAGDIYGSALAASGDILAVGAHGDDNGNGSNAGAVYLYARNTPSANAWGQVRKLEAPDGASNDVFGIGVALEGDRLVVGARGHNVAGHPGAGEVYIYERNQGGADNWGLVVQITAADRANNDNFGAAVAVSGDHVAVGTPSDDTTGSVYVFDRDQGGSGNWGQVRKLYAADASANGLFGSGVALAGDTLAVGSGFADQPGAPHAGATYIFERNLGGVDNWGQRAKRSGADAGDTDVMGWNATPIDVDTVIAGAFGADVTGFMDAGATYLFGRNQGGANNWGQARKLVAFDRQPSDYFGSSTLLVGTLAAVGAPGDDTSAGIDSGSAYIFGRDVGGAGAWGLVKKLLPISDTTPPTSPSPVTSTSHTPGVWASANQIAMQWSGASDTGGSGLDGYSVLFSTNPTDVPDSSIEVTHGTDPHTTTSPVLAGSSWYFHLRTCDHAGNCAAAVHVGPYWIDATAPTNASSLDSISHLVLPSADTTIDVTWTSGSDAGSGLDGYSYAFDTSTSWSCESTKDAEEGATTATSPALANGSWYFHICAVDYAGNWSDAATFGPLVIDATPEFAGTRVYFTGVDRINADGTGRVHLYGNPGGEFGLTFERVDRRLYSERWVSDEDGSAPLELAIGGLSFPYGVAVDRLAGRLYRTDFDLGKIVRTNLDGTGAVDLLNSLVHPLGLALDIERGKLYWCEDPNGSKIRRSNLDGSMVEDVFSPGAFAGARALALDVTSQLIYIAEAGPRRISRVGFDGTGYAVLVTSPGPGRPVGVALDVAAGKIYWAEGNRLGRANLDGTGVETFVSGAGLGKVALDIPNQAPVVTGQTPTVPQDTATPITLTATDPNHDALTYTIVDGPDHGGQLSGTPRQLTYTPAACYSGPESFTFKANDGLADSNVATVAITVQAVNHAPIASSQSVGTDEDVALAIGLSGTDPDLACGDSVSYAVDTTPSHGSLTGTAPALTYHPTANYFGADSFTFHVVDSHGLPSTTATVSIAVASVNDPPVADAQAVGTTRSTPLPITLTASDIESDPLTFAVTAGPSHGGLSGTPPAVTYTPTTGYVGPDSFDFQATDSHAAPSNTATVSITVALPPDSTPPSNPTTLASASHTASTWSSSPQIAMQWSGAADELGGSGLAGYSVLFSTNPTDLPDTTVDVPQAADPHTTTSAVLADGSSWYFHLRTCDLTDNCAATVPVGPYWIDTAPPTNPTTIASTSHTVSVASADRTVDVSWSAATDGASGVDGYGYDFTSSAASACDQVKDVEESTSTATSAMLADGSWYFHLCARDNVGNWSAAAHVGPFVVSGSAPGPGGRLFFTDYGLANIRSMTTAGTGLTVLHSGVESPRATAVDPVHGKLYYALLSPPRILRSNLDGSNVQSVLTTGFGGPFFADIDVAGGRYYWTDISTDAVYRVNLDGSGLETVATSGVSQPTGLALDLVSGKLYWNNFGNGQIERANLDGTSREVLVTGRTTLYGLAVDAAHGFIYWTESSPGRIVRANLDGSGIAILITDRSGPAGLAVDPGAEMLFWTEETGGLVMRARTDGSAITELASGTNGLALSLLASSAPRVSTLDTVADTGDGSLAENESTPTAITKFLVTFSKGVADPAGDSEADDVTNPANYRLFADGGDGFQTVDCAAGVAGSDSAVAVDAVSYDSGTHRATVSVNGGTPLADGLYRLLVCGTTSIVDGDGTRLDGTGDGTGGDDFARTFRVDQTPPIQPTLTPNRPPSTWSHDPALAVSWSGAADPGGLAGYATLFDLAPGTDPGTTVNVPQATDPHVAGTTAADGTSQYFHLRTCDLAGNCAATVAVGPFWIDTVNPSAPGAITSSHDGGAPSADNTIAASWLASTDALSGVDGYAYAFTNSATPVCDQTKDVEETTLAVASDALADGTWYLHVCAVDNAGNWGAVATDGPYLVDTAGPAGLTVSSTSHTVAAWSHDPTVDFAFNGAVDASGLSGYSIVFDQLAATEPDTVTEQSATTYTGTATPDGNAWWIHVRPCDGLGNCSSASHLGPFWIDTTVPSVPGGITSSHDGGAATADNTIAASWLASTDALSGVDGYAYAFTNSATPVCDQTKDVEESTTAVVSSALADGTRYLQVCAVDTAGNWSPVATGGPYLVDTAGPAGLVVSSTSHSGATWSTDPTVDFSFTGATDANGVVGYSLVFDRNPATVPDTVTEQAPASYTGTAAPDGNDWVLHVRACDVAGNCGATVHAGPFWIDTTAPSAPGGLASPSHTVGVPSGDPTIDVAWTSASDDTSGVQGYAVMFEGSPTASCDHVVDAGGAATGSTSNPLASGAWYVHVCAVDAAGNWGPIASAGAYTVDATPPTVTSVRPVAGSGALAEGTSLDAGVTQLLVAFSEPMATSGAGSAGTVGNHRLFAAGPNGVVDSTGCGSPVSDDVAVTLGAAAYPIATQTAALTIDHTAALPAGSYRLFACGSLTDSQSNALDGNGDTTPGDDFGRRFAVQQTDLLANPNLDLDTSGWTLFGNPGELSWQGADGDIAPSSGSAQLVSLLGAGQTHAMGQCVAVTAGEHYRARGLTRIASATAGQPRVGIRIELFPGAACAGSPSTTVSSPLVSGDSAGTWRLLETTLLTPSGTLSARVRFLADNIAGGATFSVGLDDLMFNRYIELLFTNGFEGGTTGAWSGSVTGP